jgi:hypothetical protein
MANDVAFFGEGSVYFDMRRSGAEVSESESLSNSESGDFRFLAGSS